MRWIPSQAMPLVQALWRHRWLAVGTAWLVCTVGWIGAALMPTKFESNTDPLRTPLLHGLAADTNPSRHPDFMLRTLLSRPNLEQMIRLPDLDTEIRTYSEEHPDVKAAQQSIAQLESEATKSAHGGAGKASNAANKGQIANAAYDQIKVKLVDSEAAVAAVQRRFSEAETQQAKIDAIAKSAPGVLVQAQDIDRDYSVLKRDYVERVARRESTLIANADTETEKIQFRIVDPPQVPIVPVAPNRPLLMTYVLALGIGAGPVAPLLVMQLDRSFATLGQLRNLGVPILGSVSRLSIGAAQRRAALQLIGVTASALVLVAVYGTLLMLSIGLHSVGV